MRMTLTAGSQTWGQPPGSRGPQQGSCRPHSPAAASHGELTAGPQQLPSPAICSRRGCSLCRMMSQMWRISECCLASTDSHALSAPYALLLMPSGKAMCMPVPYILSRLEPHISTCTATCTALTRVPAEEMAGRLLLLAGVVWERTFQQQVSSCSPKVKFCAAPGR